jgi:hypothetical protein
MPQSGHTSAPKDVDPFGAHRGLPVHELAVERDARVEEHRFQLPTVVPVSRPAPVASRAW